MTKLGRFLFALQIEDRSKMSSFKAAYIFENAQAR